MDLRKLRYFLTVADYENFHRAADHLHVAQSALSRHVGELEARIGAPLFERFPKGVRLTPVGRVFAEEARNTIGAMDRAYSRAKRAASGELGRLTIGMNDIAARNRLIASKIRAFQTVHPDIEFDFELMVSQEQVVALQGGRIDLAILIERPEREEFNHLTITRDPFHIALARDHPLSSRPSISVHDLTDEPFVTVKMSTFWLPQTRLLTRCRALGLTPRIVQEASNDQMQMSFIAAGLGVGFVNASARDTLGHDVVLRPVEGLDVTLDVDLVWQRNSQSAALANFLAIFRDV